MDNLNFTPFVRSAFEYKLSTKESGRHYSTDCRLFYIQSGKGSISINGKKHQIKPCFLFYIPCKTYYKIEIAEDILMYMIQFDFVSDFSHLKEPLGNSCSDSESIPDYPLPEKFSSVIFNDTSQIFEYVKSCVDEFSTRGPYWRDICASILNQGLLRLLREHDLYTDPNKRIVNKALIFTRINARNPNLSNKEIATHVGYHVDYINSLVKKATGMALRHYIIHVRVRVAKNLLCSTKMDMRAIAKRCGFNNATYFNKLFKQEVGMTPGEYRKTHLLL